MKTQVRSTRKDNLIRLGGALIGVALNVLLSYLASNLDWPLYLDTIGTMGVAMIGGMIPGVFTAVLTNTICVFFNSTAAYFSIVNALIAIFSAWYVTKYDFKRIREIVNFILALSLGSGIISAIIQWIIFGEASNESVRITMDSMNLTVPLVRFLLFTGMNILINLLDKGISAGLVLVILRYIPSDMKSHLKNGAWRQRPLNWEEMRRMDELSNKSPKSMRKRMPLLLLFSTFLLVVIMGYIEMLLYYDAAKEEETETAMNAAKFTASVVDPTMIKEYTRRGESAPGYEKTEETMMYIRENAPGVEYLYVVTIDRDAVTFVFDLPSLEESSEVEDFYPGKRVPIEEDFQPYLPALLAGEEIAPIVNSGTWKGLVTAYYPIRDENGICVAYAGADATVDFASLFVGDFLLRVIVILSGFFLLVLAYAVLLTNVYTVYPINSIAMSIETVIAAGADQQKLDESVHNIRSIDICTADEVETLYRDICSMAANQTEQLRSLNRLAENTAKLQDGLIITMADLVESRDADTGFHIQKTAAYVKIITESLKRKGYYAEKITPKFMSDVVRSAPLHDIGKINISDNVLNKPGKLTDEEYEIIKNHTVYGRQIMERAISTVDGENYLKEARNMAAYHHERWDGKGYPDGLHGEVIPLSARIMAVADVFDALTSERVYKPPYTLEQALSMIREGAGTQFDPKCVEAFMDAMPEVKLVLKKYNSKS